MSQFQDIKGGAATDENCVWFYFLRDQENQQVKCKKCGKVLKSTGGSTTGLHIHLKTIHNIVLLKRKLATDSEASTSAVVQLLKKTQTAITEYLKNQRDNTLPAVFSRLVALDGLPLSVFITSSELRMCLKAHGFEVPKSATTIRNMVVDYANALQKMVKCELTLLRSQGIRFSVTFDEWSSIRNRRYLNVEVLTQKDFWNLGLVRVMGSFPAEKCIELVQQVLQNFDLNYHRDIVCITTDGVSVMRKVGRLSICGQQLCIVHGIHLAIVDVLYKQPIKDNAVDDTTDTDDENYTDDDMDGFGGFEVAFAEKDDGIELVEDLKPLIAKVGIIVKLFRRSPTKNDETVGKYTTDEFGKPIPLVLDTKTRWNSLHAMLERFLKLKNCIRKSLIDIEFDSKIEISDLEFETISSVVACLEPVKLAVGALCRNDATLLSADTAIVFMINNWGTSDLAVRLKASLVTRINERRTMFSGLLHYLNKDHQRYENVYNALDFEKPVRYWIFLTNQ